MKKKLKILFTKITHNWHVKLISLLLAFILWVYVEGLEEKERFVSLPLEVRNVPTGFMVSGDVPDYVNVVFKGKESSFTGINWNQLKAYIDLQNNSRGHIKGVTKVDEHLLPHGVSVKEITPRVIEIQIEKVLSKKVEVVPVIVGKLPYGYNYSDIDIQPQKVTIQGPASVVESINSVTTEEINISRLTENTITEVNVSLPDKKISFLGSEKVKVKIDVVEEFVVKKIDGVEVKVIGLDDKYKASILENTVTALLKIPKRMDQNQIKEKIEIYVELSDIEKPGIYERPILFSSQIEGISLIMLEPLSARITVETVEN